MSATANAATKCGRWHLLQAEKIHSKCTQIHIQRNKIRVESFQVHQDPHHTKPPLHPQLQHCHTETFAQWTTRFLDDDLAQLLPGGLMEIRVRGA